MTKIKKNNFEKKIILKKLKKNNFEKNNFEKR